MVLVVKERTLLIGFLAVVLLLAIIFLIIKIEDHGNPISWSYDSSEDGSGSDESGAKKDCVDSSPQETSEETTPNPDGD